MASFSPPLTEAELQRAFPGRFVKLVPVDAGGQGAVFRGESAAGGVVALKIYVPDPGAQIEERTQREVAAMLGLSCRSIVKVQDYGEIQLRGAQCRFVATTFIEGQSLASLLSNGPLAIAAVAQVGHDIAIAIDALWTPDRIVHRDIKPPNVMAALGGRAVLIDLGIARHTMLDTLTMPGMAWGTMGFMSPEQFQGRKNLTCKSDVFGLGVVLRLCLTGMHPTNGNQQLLCQGCTPTAAANAPLEITMHIDQMLSPSPEGRPMPARTRNLFKQFLASQAW